VVLLGWEWDRVKKGREYVRTTREERWQKPKMN